MTTLFDTPDLENKLDEATKHLNQFVLNSEMDPLQIAKPT